MNPTALRSALAVALLGVWPAWVGAQLSFDLNKILDTASKLGQATQEMTEPREIALGRGIAARLIGAMPLVDDDAVQRYVNRLGWWLVAHTERAGLPWRFAVTDTATVGAYATPGGHVIVTRGLFVLLQDEDQLAGVLAHEIAHVLRKHHLQAIMREAQSAVMGEVGATAISALGGDNQALSSIGAEAFRAGMSLYAQGLPAEDELEADQAGLVIAARAGYDPAGLAALLFTLDSIDPDDASYELMASTHPSTRARIDAVDGALAQGLQRYPGTLEDRTRFDDIRARLWVP